MSGPHPASRTGASSNRMRISSLLILPSQFRESRIPRRASDVKRRMIFLYFFAFMQAAGVEAARPPQGPSRIRDVAPGNVATLGTVATTKASRPGRFPGPRTANEWPPLPAWSRRSTATPCILPIYTVGQGRRGGNGPRSREHLLAGLRGTSGGPPSARHLHCGPQACGSGCAGVGRPGRDRQIVPPLLAAKHPRRRTPPPRRLEGTAATC